ncbi:MAG TPA: hypothetical protein VEI02_04290, partial [Planctomycetota bacterium]|nr:hypothetical protein [Planctomycetota bacterium]
TPPAPQPAPPSGPGAALEQAATDLLTRADGLFAEGKTREASTLYQQLKQRYGRTKTYRDHKARIDERATR